MSNFSSSHKFNSKEIKMTKEVPDKDSDALTMIILVSQKTAALPYSSQIREKVTDTILIAHLSITKLEIAFPWSIN
jgi:hypothetical protein